MSALPVVVGALSCGIWAYLLAARGGFWLARERDDVPLPVASPTVNLPAGAHARGALATSSTLPVLPVQITHWPAVVAVIPARNEAGSIAQAVGSLCAQEYPGSFRIVVVDDQSDDDTAGLARRAADAAGGANRLRVLTGAPLPEGWTGKLWAVSQGIEAAGQEPGGAEWLLLTDADIAHAADNVRQLVTRALADDRVLVSLMAKLRCDAWFERALIPAFVLFFQMLYPFAWVNRRTGGIAAAAGGCVLVRRETLAAAGGVAAIRHEIIDDCALGALLKTRGAIWLGLTERAVSVRPYDSLGEIRRMVARTAYAQLKYSPLLLAGTLVSLALTFLAPPLLAALGSGPARGLGVLAWLAMALACQPLLRFYRRSPWWGPALPAVAALYTAFTFDSALQHWRGRGGMWKGRVQAPKGRAAKR
jgi:hopene-associated glycosyltransferase HpnB